MKYEYTYFGTKIAFLGNFRMNTQLITRTQNAHFNVTIGRFLQFQHNLVQL